MNVDVYGQQLTHDLYLSPPIEPHSVDLKGVGPNIVGVSERSAGESRPRALSQSAMHSFERGDRGNTPALAELAQVP